MPQEWDEHGKPVGSAAPAKEWDEHGNAVSTAGTNVAQSAAQPVRPPTALESAVGSVKNFFSGVPETARGEALGLAGGLGIPETMHPFKDLVKGTQQPPTTEQLLDPTAGGLAGAYGIAKGLYGAGKEMYQGYKQNDPEQMGHGLGYFAGQALQLGAAKKAPEGAASDYNAASALAEGARNPTGLQGTLMARALGRATQAASDISDFFKKGEGIQANSVQDSVRSIQIADTTKSRALGKRGVIDTTHAQAALDQALNTVGIQAGSASSKAIGLMEGSIRTDATFEEAKQLRSVLGTLGRATKNPADRKVIGAARQQLTEAMEARATSKDVGQTKQWKSYNDIWRNLETAKDTWQQDLYDAAAPGSGSAYTMNDIVNGKHWGKIQQAAKELKDEFGVDNKEFFDNISKLKQNVAWAPLDKAGMNFRGVINTIGKHPITGLSAYAAAQALGMPFLARFISVAAAGKLATILEQMGQPRASIPDVYGKLPEGGASPQQPPSVLTDPPHPIPPQHDYMNGAPPQTPEIQNAVESIQQERARAYGAPEAYQGAQSRAGTRAQRDILTRPVDNEVGKALRTSGEKPPILPTEIYDPSGLPPKVGTAKPIERRVAGSESYSGAERRSKLNPLAPPEGEELARQIRQARASIHQPEAGVLAKQIIAARQGSLGKATPLADPSAALAEQIKAAKQSTFAAHQRAKGKR